MMTQTSNKYNDEYFPRRRSKNWLRQEAKYH